MKKNIIIISIFITTIIGCQKDDFCIDPITPNLVIGFYDNDDPESFKKPTSLYVWADGLDSIYKDVSLDSIFLPLNPVEDFTIYHLSADGFEDQITINYLRNEVFVSRSCGYKYTFTELDLTNVSNNWILNTEITNETVANETEHIKILH